MSDLIPFIAGAAPVALAWLISERRKPSVSKAASVMAQAGKEKRRAGKVAHIESFGRYASPLVAKLKGDAR
jgi:hypothetical protein